ncbi:MAG: hypothetical protein NC035_09170 [Bacteroides sp.]|nr:hypothetical protein [Bacteroides sp.]
MKDRVHIIESLMEVVLFCLGVAAMLFVQCSCTPQKILAESAKKDSVRVVYRFDSVYNYRHDSIYIRERSDTVYVDRWHTRYKDALKVVHDTAYVDRIRETTVEVNLLTKAQRNMIAGFWTLLVLLIIAIALYVWKHWGNLRNVWLKIIAKILTK